MQTHDFGRYDARSVATIGDNLRRLRAAAGLPLEEVARRMGHKRPSTVQGWEKGRRNPKGATIRELAAALGCTPADLLRDVPHAYDLAREDGPPAAPSRIPADLLGQLEDDAIRAQVIAFLKLPDALRLWFLSSPRQAARLAPESTPAPAPIAVAKQATRRRR